MKSRAHRVARALVGMAPVRDGLTHLADEHAGSLGEILGPRRSLRVAAAVTRALRPGEALVSMPPWFDVHLALLDAAVVTPPVYNVPLPWRGHRTDSAVANDLLRAVEYAWDLLAEPPAGLRRSWRGWLTKMQLACTLEALQRRDPEAPALQVHVDFFLGQNPYWCGDPAARAEGTLRLFSTLDAVVRDVVGLPAASVEGSPG